MRKPWLTSESVAIVRPRPDELVLGSCKTIEEASGSTATYALSCSAGSCWACVDCSDLVSS